MPSQLTMRGQSRLTRNTPAGEVTAPRRGGLLRRLPALAIGILAATTLATMGTAAPAGADEFGQGNSTSGRVPDSFAHTFCFSGSGWTDTWRTVVTSRMQNLDSQTRYTDSFHSACDGSIDVQFVLDSNLGSSIRGSYRCNGENWGADGLPFTGDELCTTSTVRLNPTLLPDGHQRRKTACHEIGHSVGLAHGVSTSTFFNDCMLSGAAPSGEQFERYNTHHISHANSRTRSN